MQKQEEEEEEEEEEEQGPQTTGIDAIYHQSKMQSNELHFVRYPLAFMLELASENT